MVQFLRPAKEAQLKRQSQSQIENRLRKPLLNLGAPPSGLEVSISRLDSLCSCAFINDFARLTSSAASLLEQMLFPIDRDDRRRGGEYISFQQTRFIQTQVFVEPHRPAPLPFKAKFRNFAAEQGLSGAYNYLIVNNLADHRDSTDRTVWPRAYFHLTSTNLS